MTFDKLATALKILRTEIGKKDIPLQWIEFFLLVSASGSRGVTTMEVAEEIGMTQGIASRMVKLMSKYLDPTSRKMEGHDLFVTLPDHEYRHRQRVVLSAKGLRITKKLEQLMSK